MTTTPVRIRAKDVTKDAENGVGYQLATPYREMIELRDPDVPYRMWRIDKSMMLSRLTCIFGNGCQGIEEDRPDAGCCAHGTIMAPQELDRVSDAVARLTPDQWQNHRANWRYTRPSADGSTRVRTTKGACVFLNDENHARPGCAIHVGALDAGESPYDWKPVICSTYPMAWKHTWEQDDTVEVITIECLTQYDTYSDAHWWCFEAPEAYVSPEAFVSAWKDSIILLMGERMYGVLRDALDDASEVGTLKFSDYPDRLTVRPMADDEMDLNTIAEWSPLGY